MTDRAWRAIRVYWGTLLRYHCASVIPSSGGSCPRSGARPLERSLDVAEARRAREPGRDHPGQVLLHELVGGGDHGLRDDDDVVRVERQVAPGAQLVLRH